MWDTTPAARRAMRVAYLNPCGQMGGAEMSLMDLLLSVRAAEPMWQLCLVQGEGGPLVEKAEAAGAQVIVAPFPPALARLGDSGGGSLGALWSCFKAAAGTIRYALSLRHTLAGLQPDIIHTNGFKMHVLGAWARPKNTPVIWHVRDYVSTRPLMKRLLQLHAGRSAAVIGNSKSVARDVQNVCGPQLETLCIYNAIDLNRYSPVGEKADLDSLAGLERAPDGTVRIGLVATLAHWKGHAVFLRALARLPRDLPYRAYVIGGAIYQTENSQATLGELRELATALGIAEKVGFTGYVADTAGAIRALDILVHASTQPEPFGRVIAEGMACGRAVICSAAGGAAELITEGQDALAHAPGDDVSLAARIAELVRDPELRSRLGRAGRITAERRFELGRLSKELVPLYRRLSGHLAPEPQTQLAVTP
jgi:glycosyltransferase involved in cell wall biosynthesis